jgi:hypothetical protein
MAFSIANPTGLWPGGIVPYEIRDFAGYDRTAIRRAIQHWNCYSIIRLVPHKEETDFLVFGRRDDICQATVGRVGGEQWIRCDVGDGFDTGSIIHEIGHAIGLQHEHQRPDRDSFVTVHMGNVEDGQEHNFGSSRKCLGRDRWDPGSGRRVTGSGWIVWRLM